MKASEALRRAANTENVCTGTALSIAPKLVEDATSIDNYRPEVSICAVGVLEIRAGIKLMPRIRAKHSGRFYRLWEKKLKYLPTLGWYDFEVLDQLYSFWHLPRTDSQGRSVVDMIFTIFDHAAHLARFDEGVECNNAYVTRKAFEAAAEYLEGLGC
jgi:hypothetical protein